MAHIVWHNENIEEKTLYSKTKDKNMDLLQMLIFICDPGPQNQS